MIFSVVRYHITAIFLPVLCPAVSLVQWVHQQGRWVQRNRRLDGESELQQSWPQPDDISGLINIIVVAVVIRIRHTFDTDCRRERLLIVAICNCNLKHPADKTDADSMLCIELYFAIVLVTYVWTHHIRDHARGERGWTVCLFDCLPSHVLNWCILVRYHCSHSS